MYEAERGQLLLLESEAKDLKPAMGKAVLVPNAEWFSTISQANAVIGKWLRQYNPMSAPIRPST
jgi:hypothetical protein